MNNLSEGPRKFINGWMIGAIALEVVCGGAVVYDYTTGLPLQHRAFTYVIVGLFFFVLPWGARCYQYFVQKR